MGWDSVVGTVTGCGLDDLGPNQPCIKGVAF